MALYIVATPIGNLKDISERALETLRSCRVVVVEKWTDSIKLLNHFQIKPEKIITFDERNQHRVAPQILEILKSHDAALITSAGTPGVSDPGAMLVRLCQSARVPVVPIPGPSALASLISVSGLEGPVLFVGFLPKKKSHILKIFAEAKDNKHLLVFYESPYRIKKTLQLLESEHPTAHLFIGKEMTKKFETYFAGTASEILSVFEKDPKSIKGEFSGITNFFDTRI